ncbi:hypothetical protein [Corynebacterium glyciniphilum]|uniref:Putative secreted protein n=1 Tax=Corynebacterium glyciniphilum AJ 3170 TaxID=1404245 RepID=X5EER3_9CORY|nr:hypothetical protein [Corynebacterium glyciniphilum]AHW65116.1 Putative secreted protein [Corynebacterium glyciniphilum AJ 3170]
MNQRLSRAVLRTALGGIVLTGSVLLASCGSDIPGELADVRWQVGRIEDADLADSGTAVASSLSQTDQARTWLALGGSTVTGAAGCMSLSGDVEWLDNDRVRFPGFSARDISGESGTECLPNDSSLADRLVAVLGESSDDTEDDGEAPTLRWSTPTEDELRLTRTDDDPSNWQTGRFVEFLATP